VELPTTGAAQSRERPTDTGARERQADKVRTSREEERWGGEGGGEPSP
jgi:hypothetical protein